MHSPTGVAKLARAASQPISGLISVTGTSIPICGACQVCYTQCWSSSDFHPYRWCGGSKNLQRCYGCGRNVSVFAWQMQSCLRIRTKANLFCCRTEQSLGTDLCQPHLLVFAKELSAAPATWMYHCFRPFDKHSVAVSCLKMQRFLQFRLESHNLPFSACRPRYQAPKCCKA